MKARIPRFVLASALLGGAVGTFVGCDPKGPAEKAGRAVDRTVNP